MTTKGTEPSDAAAQRPARDIGPGLSELLSGLYWPRLLRAPGLAVLPGRLFIALLIVVLTELIWRAPELWSGDTWSTAASNAFTGLYDTGSGSILDQLWGVVLAAMLLVARVFQLFREHVLNTSLVVFLTLAVWSIGGCAIARMAAADFSQGVLIPWAEGRNFAWTRKGSVILAVLGPVILAVIMVLGLAVAGWALFSLPWVNVLGAILYSLALAVAAVLVVLVAAYAIGFPMLVPAVACEGSDGIDAIGRAYAYVLSKPLRLVGYAIILVALGIIAVRIAFWATDSVVWFAAYSASLFAGETATAILNEQMEPALTGSAAYSSRIVRFWTSLVGLLGTAYFVSYFHCASTTLYLLMRRACDGQDPAELWMPTGTAPRTDAA